MRGFAPTSTAPPTFYDTTISIYENATTNAFAGSPLVATPADSTAGIQYSITGGNGSSVFWIGMCDGQVRLIQGGSLNYWFGPRVYILKVTAVPNAVVASAANATVTVKVRLE